MRIPLSRPDFSAHTSLGSLSDCELRLFARQHIFCGYSLLEGGVAGTADPPGVKCRRGSFSLVLHHIFRLNSSVLHVQW